MDRVGPGGRRLRAAGRKALVAVIMNTPFVDLKAQFAAIESDVRTRLERVFEHCQFVMGPEVAELEAALAARIGVKHAISCASGTDALLLPLMAHEVGPGDGVITTPFTFVAAAEVISLLGATPIFVDIDPRTYNIDAQRLQSTVEDWAGKTRLRGIVPVDLFGLPADYEQINRVASEHGLFVLEDAAQSFGAQHRGRPAGALAHAATTSFFPAKPLGCYGDGGAVFTDDEEFAGLLRSLRIHGQGSHPYDNVRVGVNGRFDTMQAAVLLAKLAVFDQELAARRRIAGRYNDTLSGRVTVPHVPRGDTSAWAQYSVQAEHRDEVRERLAGAGIPTAVYYARPLHLQPAFSGLGYRVGDFPIAEQVAARIFSLPVHPYLTDAQIEHITDAVREAVPPVFDRIQSGEGSA